MVPTANQAVSPFMFEHAKNSSASRFRSASERVAIEIDEIIIGNDELIAKWGQGIEAVEF